MALQPNDQFSIEPSQEQGFVSFYRSLPQKPSTTLRIFDRSDFFTVHGEDALFTAKEVYKTTTTVKYLGPANDLPSVVLNKSNFEFWIRELLLVRQYRVEIYRNKGTNKNQEWVLEHKASPGNLGSFEDILFAGGDTTNLIGVMAIKVGMEAGNKVVGVGYIDTNSRKLLISEFTDNEHFSNLEALTVQLGASECLLQAGEQSADYSKIKQVLGKSSILVTERKKIDFQTKDIVQDLNRLLRLDKGFETCMHLPEINKKIAISAVAALIKFLGLLNEEGNLGHYKLKSFDMTQYVKLDMAAVDALQLFPTVNDTNKLQALYGVLNKCRTGQGQRLMAQWIKQPLMDLNKIEERQNLIEVFVENGCLMQLLHEDYLRKIPDLQRLMRKFTKKSANLQDCYKVYQALTKLPALVDALENQCNRHQHLIKANFGTPLTELLVDFSKFQQMIEVTMDLSLVDSNEFVIKAEFDETLTELREKIDSLEERMKALLKKVLADLGSDAGKSIKLESNVQLGYYFRVTLKEEKIIRGNHRYKIIDANKTGVRFRNNEMSAMNDDYLLAKEQYEEQQKAVVDEVLGIAGGYLEPMSQLCDVLAELDVIVSLAVATSMAPTPYVKPRLLPKGSGVLNLVQVRHPSLELQENVAYIPNDTTFSNEKRFHIITGPNMGGKSTYMRAVGITVLLAQIGSFVPCQDAEISLVDAILTRVGCEDNHNRGISTFMLEMLEMASILRTATRDSLLIIDELGRGTSTYDGFGLAWAISEKIAGEIKSLCMFATHFHELTTLEEKLSSVQNFHVTALIGSNGPTFLYRVKPGVCDRSFGIHVAEMVKFPEEVLQYARKKIQDLEDFQTSSSGEYTDLCANDEKAVKFRQRVKKEGEQIIFEFLHNVKQLDTNTMTEDELICTIEKLKSEVLAKKNAYVECILKKEEEEIMMEFLRDVKGIDTTAMTEEERSHAVEKLKSEIL